MGRNFKTFRQTLSILVLNRKWSIGINYLNTIKNCKLARKKKKEGGHEWFLPELEYYLLLIVVSPWYNCTGWLGVKHQFTYLLIILYSAQLKNNMLSKMQWPPHQTSERQKQD